MKTINDFIVFTEQSPNSHSPAMTRQNSLGLSREELIERAIRIFEENPGMTLKQAAPLVGVSTARLSQLGLYQKLREIRAAREANGTGTRDVAPPPQPPAPPSKPVAATGHGQPVSGDRPFSQEEGAFTTDYIRASRPGDSMTALADLMQRTVEELVPAGYSRSAILGPKAGFWPKHPVDARPRSGANSADVK